MFRECGIIESLIEVTIWESPEINIDTSLLKKVLDILFFRITLEKIKARLTPIQMRVLIRIVL